MRRIRYVVTLKSDYDRIRVDFETDHGEVITLHVVQYETRYEGEWQPVARYDTAHGFFHLDLHTVREAMKYRIYMQNFESSTDICNRRFKGQLAPVQTAISRRWVMVKTMPSPSSDETFEYLKMFNHVVVSDEEFATWLPETEFELSFSREGDVYVNGKPLEVNVKERYEALAPR